MNATQNLIFVVDDDPLIRNLLDHTIRNRWGYRIRLFSGKNEQIWKPEETPDLVILDIMLSDSNGLDVLKKIKEHLPEVPVLMLSSQTDVGVAIETMRLGAMDYFTKPVDMQRVGILHKECAWDFAVEESGAAITGESGNLGQLRQHHNTIRCDE